MQFLKQIIFNRKSSGTEGDLCRLTTSYCKFEFTAATTWLAFSMGLMVISLTVCLFVDTNDLKLPLYFLILLLPFEGISINWMLNYIFQFVTSLLSAIFIELFFVFNLLIMNHSCFLFDATILLVYQLSPGESGDASSKHAIDEKLKTIIEAINQLHDWQKDVQDLTRLNFLVDFTVLAFLFCNCVFTLTENFFGSTVVLFGLVVILSQLFFYCWMGTRVTTRIEKLSAALYDTEWYSMAAEHQKDLQFNLLMTQNMKGFDGIFNELSLATFEKVRNILFLGISGMKLSWVCFQILQFSYSLLAVIRRS